MRRRHLLWLFFLGIGGCNQSSPPSGDPQTVPSIRGEGATFPEPLYRKWFAEYALEKGVRVAYNARGSSAGIESVMLDTADFGASDAPMTDDELSQAGAVLHIPMTLGAVAVVYNLPDAPAELKLTPEVLARIYLGEITHFNDQRILQLNPDETLPDLPIEVVHRSDGSGTTAVFAEYLALYEPWRERMGAKTRLKWPVGVGAAGNSGVANRVRTHKASLGYVSLAYAHTLGLPVAALWNAAGHYVVPTLDSVTEAAASAAGSLPDDLRVSLVNVKGEPSYPLASFSFILVREDAPDEAKRRTVAEFLWWAVHDGQKYGPFLHYATLPPEVVKKVETRLKRLRAEGKTLF